MVQHIKNVVGCSGIDTWDSCFRGQSLTVRTIVGAEYTSQLVFNLKKVENHLWEI